MSVNNPFDYRVKIYPDARQQIKSIWRYTYETWGGNQADRYLQGLNQSIHDVYKKKNLWRYLHHDTLKDIYFIRYKHHYIFFKELDENTIGILSILHESMDFLSHLPNTYH